MRQLLPPPFVHADNFPNFHFFAQLLLPKIHTPNFPKMILLLLPLLATLLPLTFAHPATLPNPPTWTISNFAALTTPNWSRASFTFQDAGPLESNMVILDCKIEHPIYRDKFMACDAKMRLMFKLSESEITLRRTFSLPSGQRVTGTAPQSTNWAEGGNQTSGEDWTFYSRMEEWPFAVTMIAG
ncbi:hypothetical protein CC80DRAFT_193108 [Byssothecium circinans]|uniref:AA1-like domain-containing protein n=1 Tax=Byssothecium circinans TaxID=147558 RepID=A0A6A5THA2_9PLEO|nr:hypothetical protein CC80DRAFT_193108 [Byssothecium circinans]